MVFAFFTSFFTLIKQRLYDFNAQNRTNATCLDSIWKKRFVFFKKVKRMRCNLCKQLARICKIDWYISQRPLIISSWYSDNLFLRSSLLKIETCVWSRSHIFDAGNLLFALSINIVPIIYSYFFLIWTLLSNSEIIMLNVMSCRMKKTATNIMKKKTKQ